MCIPQGNLIFSTVIPSTVFSDDVIFYGMYVLCAQYATLPGLLSFIAFSYLLFNLVSFKLPACQQVSI